MKLRNFFLVLPLALILAGNAFARFDLGLTRPEPVTQNNCPVDPPDIPR